MRSCVFGRAPQVKRHKRAESVVDARTHAHASSMRKTTRPIRLQGVFWPLRQQSSGASCRSAWFVIVSSDEIEYLINVFCAIVYATEQRLFGKLFVGLVQTRPNQNTLKHLAHSSD